MFTRLLIFIFILGFNLNIYALDMTSFSISDFKKKLVLNKPNHCRVVNIKRNKEKLRVLYNCDLFVRKGYIQKSKFNNSFYMLNSKIQYTNCVIKKEGLYGCTLIVDDIKYGDVERARVFTEKGSVNFTKEGVYLKGKTHGIGQYDKKDVGYYFSSSVFPILPSKSNSKVWNFRYLETEENCSGLEKVNINEDIIFTDCSPKIKESNGACYQVCLSYDKKMFGKEYLNIIKDGFINSYEKDFSEATANVNLYYDTRLEVPKFFIILDGTKKPTYASTMKGLNKEAYGLSIFTYLLLEEAKPKEVKKTPISFIGGPRRYVKNSFVLENSNFKFENSKKTSLKYDFKFYDGNFNEKTAYLICRKSTKNKILYCKLDYSGIWGQK